MFCRQCGNPIPDGEKFCNQCGTPLAAEEAYRSQQKRSITVPYAGAEPGSVYAPPVPFNTDNIVYRVDRTETDKKKNLRTILLIAGSVLVVATAVLIPVLIEKARSDRYEAAFAMMDSGGFEEAKAEFIELGEYRESPDMAEECQSTLDYNAAMALKNTGDFEKARDAFKALGSFEDASELSTECQNTMDYNAAVALMDAASNEEARDAFTALGGFKDSTELAAECQNRIDYGAATALMNSENYEAALTAFTALGYYSDASDLALQCQHNIDYIAADAAFNEGNFYTAFLGFSSLADFKDSAARCLACIQKPPKNGEQYHNPDFGKNVSVTFKVGDQSRSVFLKIYSEDNKLVSTIFVAKNSKVKVKLPKGKYRFKAAYGTDWFGDKELFGKDAVYELLIFEDGELTSLSGGYIYTISLLLQEGEGNINSAPETLDSF